MDINNVMKGAKLALDAMGIKDEATRTQMLNKLNEQEIRNREMQRQHIMAMMEQDKLGASQEQQYSTAKQALVDRFQQGIQRQQLGQSGITPFKVETAPQPLSPEEFLTQGMMLDLQHGKGNFSDLAKAFGPQGQTEMSETEILMLPPGDPRRENYLAGKSLIAGRTGAQTPTKESWTDWGYGKKRNTATGEVVDVPVAPPAQKPGADIDVQAIADSIAEGNDSRSAVKGSMGNPVASRAQSLVLKKYPKFNFMMSDANYKWKQSATNQRTINFVGGVLPRLDVLVRQVNSLQNTSIPKINEAMRIAARETGKPEYTNFESNRNAIVQEVGTALSGSSTPSDLRIKIELENLKSAMSPEQLRGAINNLNEALIARLDVDLSNIYPIEVVQGRKTMEQYKNELYAKYRRNFQNQGNIFTETQGAETTPQSKTIVKQYYSKSTGKTKYVYSDGTEEIK